MKKDQNTGYIEGIFQSIGFKEFHEFLVGYEGRVFDESSLCKENKDLLWECINNMKMVTRRYAKKKSCVGKESFFCMTSGLSS